MAKPQRVLSIEIGYSLTQVCEMDYQSKHPKVYGVFSMKSPEGILEDGYVRVNQDFVMQLKANLSANGMIAKKVMFVVSSTKIANREAKIPAVKEKQIKDLVMSNITDYFPVDPSMYRFTYTVMNTVADEAGNKQHHLMLMAAPADMLEGYVELARALELEFDSIDYSGNSIFQALKQKFGQGVNLIVKIDERSSLITVTNNGAITMQRAGMYGADQIVDVMLETDVYGEDLSYDSAVKTLRRNNLVMRAEEEEVLDQREKDAEKIAKENALLLQNATAEGDHRNMAAATVAAKQADANLKMLRLRKEITYSYQQLISSIVRVIDYYNSKNRDAAIDKIVLTGIAADFWGFSNLLSEELGREVEVLRDLAGTNINQGLHLQEVSLGDYITVIGAPLSNTGFTPASIERAKKDKGTEKGSFVSQDQLPMVVCIAGTAIAVAYLALTGIPFATAKVSNTDLINKKRQLSPVQEVYNEYTQTQADYNYLTTVYAQTENYNRALYDLFGVLEEKSPSVLEVKNMTIDSSKVVLNISVPHKRAAAQFVMNLREVESFSDVQVTSLVKRKNTENETQEEIFESTITCTYGVNPSLAEETTEETSAEGTEAEVADENTASEE